MVRLILIQMLVTNRHQETQKNLQVRRLRIYKIREIRKVPIEFMASSQMDYRIWWIICHNILRAHRRWRIIQAKAICSQTSKYWPRRKPKHLNLQNQVLSRVHTEDRLASWFLLRLRVNSIYQLVEMQALATWASAILRRMSWITTNLIKSSCTTIQETSIWSTRRTLDTRSLMVWQIFMDQSRDRECLISKINRSTSSRIRHQSRAKSQKFKIKLVKDFIWISKNLVWKVKVHKEWSRIWWATLRTSTSRRSRWLIRTTGM